MPLSPTARSPKYWVVVQPRGDCSDEFVLALRGRTIEAAGLEVARVLLTRTAHTMAQGCIYDIDPDDATFDGRQPVCSLTRFKAEQALKRVRRTKHWELPKVSSEEVAKRRERQTFRETVSRRRVLAEARQVWETVRTRPSAGPIFAGTTRYLDIVQREPISAHPVKPGTVLWIPTAEIEAFERDVATMGMAATLYPAQHVGPLVTASIFWEVQGDEETQRWIWVFSALRDLRPRFERFLPDMAWPLENALRQLLGDKVQRLGWHHKSSALPGLDEDDTRSWMQVRTEDDFFGILAHQVEYVRHHWTIVRIHQRGSGLHLVG